MWVFIRFLIFFFFSNVGVNFLFFYFWEIESVLIGFSFFIFWGKKKSIIPKIFSSKRDERGGSDEDIFKSDDGGIDLGIFLYSCLSIRVGHALEFYGFFFNIN